MIVSCQTRQAIRDHHERSSGDEVKRSRGGLSERRDHTEEGRATTGSRTAPNHRRDSLASLPSLAPSFPRHQGAAAGAGVRQQLWDTDTYMGSPNTFLSLKSPSRNTPHIDHKKWGFIEEESSMSPTNSCWVLTSRHSGSKA